jgi:hypothetical protein
MAPTTRCSLVPVGCLAAAVQLPVSALRSQPAINRPQPAIATHKQPPPPTSFHCNRHFCYLLGSIQGELGFVLVCSVNSRFGVQEANDFNYEYDDDYNDDANARYDDDLSGGGTTPSSSIDGASITSAPPSQTTQGSDASTTTADPSVTSPSFNDSATADSVAVSSTLATTTATLAAQSTQQAQGSTTTANSSATTPSSNSSAVNNGTDGNRRRRHFSGYFSNGNARKRGDGAVNNKQRRQRKETTCANAIEKESAFAAEAARAAIVTEDQLFAYFRLEKDIAECNMINDETRLIAARYQLGECRRLTHTSRTLLYSKSSEDEFKNACKPAIDRLKTITKKIDKVSDVRDRVKAISKSMGQGGLKNAGMLRLKIFYEHLNVEIYETSRSMTFVQLLCSLGGNLGLFLGFSVVTILEFLEYVSVLLVYFSGYASWLRRRPNAIGRVH